MKRVVGNRQRLDLKPAIDQDLICFADLGLSFHHTDAGNQDGKNVTGSLEQHSDIPSRSEHG
jgi:hypothetical protein